MIDRGAENKKAVKTLLDKYEIKQVLISAYHSQTNDMIEQRHWPTIDMLAKIGEVKI